ncbi:sigma-70 family RNA polymerase sigma factor [Spirosoma terrae]|uniref:RNA polymerase sigma factor n=1 Tax=Spirosoma terrae TaxID=1968276 RepID=A0A6L9L2J5_9BACT|nr:RNA polymerase sigma factor [Spirosoma terrae]NDU93617.1 RNA polymerase sigma factor [Spirosoma terrae]
MALFGHKSYRTLTELVVGCQQGQPRAQRAFYERYQARMLGVCVRYARTVAEAEDIFQEAFVKVFAHIEELDKPESADSWVKAVVVRTAINYYHRVTRPQENLTSYEALSESPSSDDHLKLLAGYDQEAILGLLARLPDAYRLVVNLYLIEGYTHAEIAQLINVPEATARSRFSRARQLLLTLINHHGLQRHEFLG